MMTAWVFGVMRASNASSWIWKRSRSGGTKMKREPLPRTNTPYSGKQGAMARISEPSTRRAVKTAVSAGAAPQVKNRSSGRTSMPERRLMSAATVFRSASEPPAGV